MTRLAQAQALATRNAAFNWWDTSICPRVAVLESAGRAIAADEKPRSGLTPATLAARMHALRDQRMMVAKFPIYRSWKGREDERFQVQREILAYDPDTFQGIGAAGYLGMHGRSDTPYLTFGWKSNQLNPGLNHWRLTDTAYFFAHASVYQVTLAHAGGKDKARVKRLAFTDGAIAIAEARPGAELGPGPFAKVVATHDCAAWQLWNIMAKRLLPHPPPSEVNLNPQQLEARPKIVPFRGEHAAEHEEFQWAAPLKVLVSSDGREWTEVAAADQADAVMRVDLTNNAPRVRIERQPPTPGSKPGRLHLRIFLVYGRKLY